MAHQVHHLFGGEHLGFGVKSVFEFGVVHLGVPGGDNEDGLAIHLKGQGLGDPGGDDAGGLGGQLHRGAGGLKFQDILLTA